MIWDCFARVSDPDCGCSGAIVAAAITAWVIWKSANRPVEAQGKRDRAKEDRRLRHGCLKLSHDLQILHRKARKVETEIRMQITAEEAGTGRVGLNVSLPELTIIMDWKVMSLMSSDICERCFTLLGQTTDHNNDISDAVPAFKGDEFRDHLFKRLQKMPPLNRWQRMLSYTHNSGRESTARIRTVASGRPCAA